MVTIYIPVGGDDVDILGVHLTEEAAENEIKDAHRSGYHGYCLSVWERELESPLIAAAPDLLAAAEIALEALEPHLQYDDGHSLEREAYEALRAAIAKARGES